MRFSTKLVTPLALAALCAALQAQIPSDGWSWLREEKTGWRKAGSAIELRAQKGRIWAGTGAKNLLVEKAEAGGRSARVTVTHDAPETKYEQGGLLVYRDDDHFVKLINEFIDGEYYVVMASEVDGKRKVFSKIKSGMKSVRLGLSVDGDTVRAGFSAPDATDLQDAGTCELPGASAAHFALFTQDGSAEKIRWIRFEDLTAGESGAGQQDSPVASPADDEELGRIETAESAAAAARHEEKLDPTRDGWDSEAFSDAAQAQLNEIGSMLIDPSKLSASALGKLVDLDKITLDLLEPAAATVFESADLEVERAAPPESRPPRRDALDQLKALAANFAAPKKKFKLFKVSLLPDGKKAQTRQFFAISDHAQEINATWDITWDIATTRIEKIQVLEFERVRRKQAGTMFSDATGSVLPDDPATRNHLGHGINYWQGRVEKILSMHYFGHNGIAVGDVNGDGLDDLYSCQSAAVPNKLLVQQADGTTIDAAAASGVDLLNATRAALLVDLDNDGDQDLAATTPYATLVFANDGAGNFSLAQNIGLASGGYSLTASDYDNDGDLDLYVCVYYRKPGDASALAYPIPYHDANNGGQNFLLRNEGGLQFVDATEETGTLAENYRFSFAASWEDVDADGDQDVYVANDYGRNNLYRNQLSESGKATFTSDAANAGIEDTSFGMSVCWGDADGDGKIDLYTGNMFSGAGNRIAFQDRFQQHAPGEIKAKLQRTARGNSLFLNRGDATFEDVTMSAGARQGRWAWGSIFGDVNNDGLEDLIVANGFVTGKREDDL